MRIKILKSIILFSFGFTGTSLGKGEGHGKGDIDWFVAENWVKSTEQCITQIKMGGVTVHTTKVGERPGAKLAEMQYKPNSIVNICVHRPPSWIFRSGMVTLIWLPDRMETSRHFYPNPQSYPFPDNKDDLYQINLREEL
ncbi:uncharacterized protein LOC111712664 [Eurytemora carolleeae]|uniref:uncharacterized protein LOC111712664 n=1 Tax=Eurytemora carolleeae TaxID=1294199 RepID=UPI000C770F64|nr:uncharacterized protein LOC111712664 [Eurytemora carolleeae]|eukprot:XP_023343111.1 uncharacterized protein LOC111712664 [Eurytemora affinis]